MSVLKNEEMFSSTIVDDFKTYLTYLSTHQIKLTKVKGYFTKKDLLALYPQMKSDKSEIPQHSAQNRYPILHLFYHISIVLEFFKVNRTKSSAVAIVKNEVIDIFMNMTETEQYLTLLEAFWQEADWEELQGEEWGGAPINIDFLFEEFDEIPPNQEIDLSRFKKIKGLVFNYGSFFYYFGYFGLWKVMIDQEKTDRPGGTFQTYAKSIMLTPFFKAMQPALSKTWNPYKDINENGILPLFEDLFSLSNEPTNNEIEETEDENTESLSELSRPLFPKEAFTTILKKKQPSYKEGTYLFKVKLSSSCWRKLQCSSNHTLLDLHNLIQEAFNFDDDHLYAFYMDGKRFGKSYYNSPMDFRGPYVDEINLGGLNLDEGQSFLYLFDFGDEWTFDVQVVAIIEGEDFSKPQIVEGFGEAPEQYSW